MNGCTVTGLRVESRGPPEDLHVLPQPAVLPPQRGQPLTFTAGQAIALSRVGPSPLDPVAHRGLRRTEVLGELTDRAVTTPAQLHGLGPEPGMNDQRGRGSFFPMLSITDIHPGPNP
ncbi:hypothetical protein [Streptomyces sp. NPDC007205]|uniref:hypothetical protein n=1 Tax=Streptomyces sp. NPDC007205 TaxID=3154316 RepID=UPI0033EB71BD